MERTAINLVGNFPEGMGLEREIVPVPEMKFGCRTIQVHHVTLPDGSQKRWESLYRQQGKPTVLMCGLTKDNELILIENFRFPVGDRVIELPGGTVDPEEEEQEAVAREFMQETGFTTSEPFVKFPMGWLHNSLSDESFEIYLAQNCHKVGEPQLDDLEKAVGLKVFTEHPRETIEKIANGSSRQYDPVLSVALIGLLGRGFFKL